LHGHLNVELDERKKKKKTKKTKKTKLWCFETDNF